MAATLINGKTEAEWRGQFRKKIQEGASKEQGPIFMDEARIHLARADAKLPQLALDDV